MEEEKRHLKFILGISNRIQVQEKNVEICILGAGPAGMGAVHELVKNGRSNILVLDRNHIVGGLARTEEFDGARFDVGPHRFFSKNSEINQLWQETLGNDFLPVDRLTRIHFGGKFYSYPLKPFEALGNLGVKKSLLAVFSYLSAQVTSKTKTPATFEDWIVQKFGRRLYETFFKTYTEKVWGIPCAQIGAEWAAQRIRGLDVFQVIKNALFFPQTNKIKTLVDRFRYPVRGAGQMYEVMKGQQEKYGAEFWLQSEVVAIHQKEDRVHAVEVSRGSEKFMIKADVFFTSIPLTHFFKLLSPRADEVILRAADELFYRDHITINLKVDSGKLFPDQWVYVHEPEAMMARVANYNNFSPLMAGGIGKSALSCEYFVFKNEKIWQMPDDKLVELACEELEKIKLLGKVKIEGAWVVRETESYPTYYLGFKEPYDKLKKSISKFTNIYPIGRGGLYKYNNQDHSTLSGFYAARNYMQIYDGAPYDLWRINTDEQYQESERVSS